LNYCPRCGKEFPSDSTFCPSCGLQLKRAQPAIGPARKANPRWWLLPIFFAIFGGIIAYLVNRRDNPRTAKNQLIVGIMMTFILVPLVIFAYDYVSGLMSIFSGQIP